MNNVQLLGNLVRDNEYRTFQDNKKVLNNTIAIQRIYKNQNGEREADFINFVAYEQNADILLNFTRKGSKVLLEGEWRNRTYTKQNGEKAYVSEMLVNRVHLIDRLENKSIIDRTNEVTNPYYQQNQYPQYQTQAESKMQKFDPNPQFDISDADLPF